MSQRTDGDPPWRGGGPPWRGGGPPWGRRRGPFLFLRFAAIFGLLTLFFVGWVGAVAFLLTRAFGAGGPTAQVVWLTMCGFALVFPLLVVGTARRAFRSFATPLANLMAAADAVARGDLSVRVPVSGRGDFSRLAESFNHMTAELQRADQQRRNLTADVAHELRTPLHVIQGNLEGILDGVYQPGEEHIQATLSETRALARLVEDLRTLSLAEAGQLPLLHEPVDLAELVADVVTSFSGQADAAGVTLRVEVMDGEGERAAPTSPPAPPLEREGSQRAALVPPPLAREGSQRAALVPPPLAREGSQREALVPPSLAREGSQREALVPPPLEREGSQREALVPPSLRGKGDRGLGSSLLTITGDAGRLDQVLSNLVANALRHTPAGGVITLSAAPFQDEGQTAGVRLTVQDTGEGIPTEDVPYIFDRFWRGDRSRTHSRGAGSGLGLAIARQLVQAHSGVIRVESKVGIGTTFTIDLPTITSVV